MKPSTSLAPLRALALLVLVPLSACESAGSPPPRPAQQIQILPAGGDTYFVFRADGAEERAGADKVVRTVPAGSKTGLPCASALDLGGEYGVVAYATTMARVKLSERDVRWLPPTWDAAPATIAVRGSLALALEGERLSLTRLDDEKVPWKEDLGPQIKRFGLGTLHFAVPLSETQYMLVSHKGFETRIQRFDRSGGGRSDPGDQRISSLHELHACASDGTALYLAGIQITNERTSATGMSMGDQRVTLLVYRVDFERLEARPIVELEEHDPRFRVAQIAVGLDLLIVVDAAHELSVFRIRSKGATSERVLKRQFTQGIQAAWLGENRIAVLGLDDGKVTVLDDLAGSH